jgi:hypothetical protein
MNERERLLALEAALTACEDINFGDKHNDFTMFHQIVMHKLKVGFSDVAYGDYLKEQNEAVKKLAQSPETYGFEE